MTTLLANTLRDAAIRRVGTFFIIALSVGCDGGPDSERIANSFRSTILERLPHAAQPNRAADIPSEQITKASSQLNAFLSYWGPYQLIHATNRGGGLEKLGTDIPKKLKLTGELSFFDTPYRNMFGAKNTASPIPRALRATPTQQPKYLVIIREEIQGDHISIRSGSRYVTGHDSRYYLTFLSVSGKNSSATIKLGATDNWDFALAEVTRILELINADLKP